LQLFAIVYLLEYHNWEFLTLNSSPHIHIIRRAGYKPVKVSKIKNKNKKTRYSFIRTMCKGAKPDNIVPEEASNPLFLVEIAAPPKTRTAARKVINFFEVP